MQEQRPHVGDENILEVDQADGSRRARHMP
jgi:hypothetical protein